MNQSGPPPQVPPGWVAVWDESAQRYYFVNEATGASQWELPPSDYSKAAEAGSTATRGEADSYNSGYASSSPYPQQQPAFPSANSPYPQQPQAGGYDSSYPQQPQAASYSENSTYSPQQHQQQQLGPNGQPGEEVIGPNGERGIGKMFTGFSGGAITGTLIGFAAGKLLGNHNSGKHNQGGYANYGPPPGPPPPQNYYGYGPPQGYGQPQNYGPPQGYGNYGQPPKKHHFF